MWSVPGGFMTRNCRRPQLLLACHHPPFILGSAHYLKTHDLFHSTQTRTSLSWLINGRTYCRTTQLLFCQIWTSLSPEKTPCDLWWCSWGLKLGNFWFFSKKNDIFSLTLLDFVTLRERSLSFVLLCYLSRRPRSGWCRPLDCLLCGGCGSVFFFLFLSYQNAPFCFIVETKQKLKYSKFISWFQFSLAHKRVRELLPLELTIFLTDLGWKKASGAQKHRAGGEREMNKMQWVWLVWAETQHFIIKIILPTL